MPFVSFLLFPFLRIENGESQSPSSGLTATGTGGTESGRLTFSVCFVGDRVIVGRSGFSLVVPFVRLSLGPALARALYARSVGGKMFSCCVLFWRLVPPLPPSPLVPHTANRRRAFGPLITHVGGSARASGQEDRDVL